METISWVRQWSQSEHNTLEIPKYTDFWVTGIGANNTPTYIGVETFGDCTKIIVVRNNECTKAGVDVVTMVPDVEEIIKYVKKLFAKVDGIRTCSRQEFLDSLQSVIYDVVCVDSLVERNVDDIQTEDEEYEEE